MSVYVDESKHKFQNMIMCHMIADTERELHEMAHAIGVSRQFFQESTKTNTPHYDICKSKRALAVRRGAIQISCKELVSKAIHNFIEMDNDTR